MDRLPPSVLVAIGRHLEDGDRNACVLASRDLWPVHESSTRHTLTYYPPLPDGVERIRHVRATVAHVLALKPRLRTLDVRLISLGSGCAALFEFGVGVHVHLAFSNCSPAFVRAVAARGTSVSINVDASDDVTAENVDGFLRSLAPKVASVGCTHLLFQKIPVAAFDDVACVRITVLLNGHPPVVDLRDLKGAAVELDGDVMWCTVYGACKLASVSDARGRTPVHLFETQLCASLRQQSVVLSVRRVNVVHAGAVWHDLIALLPPTVEYTVTVTAPACLRLIERLEERGVTSICLSATSRDAYVLARLTCLMLKKRYPIVFLDEHVSVGDLSDPRLSVRDLFGRLHPTHQEVWFAAKYCG